MAEILKNTGAKLWSMVDDHDELQSNVFDQLFGTGGKSDIRLIDEAIGKINESLDGYYFKIINDKLCICKDTDSGTTSLPLSITDDNGHIALKVDGTSITIDGNGVVHGATVDDAFSLISENAIQNKVVKAKFDEIDGKVKANETTISSHISDNNNPHNVTKSQVGLGNVENKSSETIRGEITKDNVTTALGYTPYTPNEVDNKFSAFETNIQWKEAVDTFADIATTYPSPKDGWTVNTKDNDYTYRYDGAGWITISANAIPKATDSVDGLLTKEDHVKYEDAASNTHIHNNKSVLDGITSVDSELSTESENPVQNKVVTASISDTKDSKVTFESNDTLAPTELSDMPSVLKSGETHASMLSKIATVFRNMRYIIGLLGSTDISKETLGIGDSTVTGAIKGLNESLTKDSLNNLLFKAIDVERIDKEDKYNVDTLPYGVYYITSNKSINGPSGERYIVYITIASYNILKPAVQIAFPIESTKMYFRTCSGAGWCPWRAVSAT